ncbi:MAG: hypothetical protein N2319_09100 [Candidatus Kapabacteria bacterium]|nr:hypothetical protein [Candidatus Kapabacteria bacterium]
MKVYLFLLIIFCFLFVNGKLFSQDDRLDELEFESATIKEEKPPYFAIGGGYTGTFIFTNFDELNKKLLEPTYRFPENALSAPIFLSGVQGFTAIGIIPNVRLGFLGMGGSKSVEKKDTVINLNKHVEYSLSFQGISIDYGIILMKSLALIPGLTFGWGNRTIEVYQAPAEVSWDGFQAIGDLNKFLNRAEGNFYFVQPNVNFEYALTPFFMIRANAGYALSFSGDWTFNRTAKLINVPDKIDANGFTVQFGLFLGLFNY